LIPKIPKILFRKIMVLSPVKVLRFLRKSKKNSNYNIFKVPVQIPVFLII